MTNPFALTKAEEFNHSYEDLASLMSFKAGVADILLNSSNVFVTGSRGSGKSMYLRLLSFPVKSVYERLARKRKVEPLPSHKPYLGVYIKLAATVFGPHEYETKERFQDMFQQLFNIYCAEHIADTVLEAMRSGLIKASKTEEQNFIGTMAEAVLLQPVIRPKNAEELVSRIHQERIAIRQRLNALPYTPDQRSQPDVLWDTTRALGRISKYSKMRVHLLIDEFDSLSPLQQRIVNNYLRKRDFPITFKIACKKHSLELTDTHAQPLNPSGDFSRVELDDERLGTGPEFSTYLEDIANKRLRKVGITLGIRELLGKAPPQTKPKTERRYFGFRMVVTLSSGIVRTFLELCRDMYARVVVATESEIPSKIKPEIQDSVIKDHASLRWNSLSRDHSARPELQQLIDRVVELFRQKAKGSEHQIIRLEILDHKLLSSFSKKLLDQALDYEALVQPNMERLQKNTKRPSRGYVLNRLLCVHFRLEPSSRWDAEISAQQFERLVLGPQADIRKIASQSSKGAGKTLPKRDTEPKLFNDTCPIRDQDCTVESGIAGAGFLACPLPDGGRIKDATQLIVDSFRRHSDLQTGIRYEIKTAQDYPPEGDIACKVCRILSESQFTLVELSKFSPSVTMELGMSIARQKPTFVLFSREEQPDPPEPFSSLEYIPYSTTPQNVQEIVANTIIPCLQGGRGRIPLGPEEFPGSSGNGVFLAFPGEPYYQETILPKLQDCLKSAGLTVRTEQEGRALGDLDRAANAIASSEYCLIDITYGAPTRALYLGLALGYRKKFASFINREKDPETGIFTDARSKAQFDYRDSQELLARMKDFFTRYGIRL